MPPTRATSITDHRLLLSHETEPGFFGSVAQLETVGCPCLDCGHVMLFLTSEALQTARTAPVLTPKP
jgi:hypothetical protein